MIAFDSCVLIAGIQRRDRRKAFIARCADYLEKLKAEKARVVLPAPAVWEFLCGYPPSRIQPVVDVLQRRFRIAPFGLKAADIAARIQIAHGLKVVESETGKKARTSSIAVQQASRQHIKLDVAVLASAIAVGATRLVTDEGKERDKFVRWAQGWPISIIEVPKGERQSLLEFES